MALRTAGRKLSFDVLRHRDDDDDAAVPINRAESDPMQTTTTQKSRKQRRNKKKKDQKLLESSFVKGADPCSFVEDSRTLNSDSVTSDPHFPLQNGSACNGFELELVARKFYSTGSVTLVEEEESAASVCTGPATGFNFGELRQRAVNSGSSEDLANSAAVAVDGGGKDDGGAKASPTEKPKLTNENDRNGGVAKLETVESLDWRHVMVEDPNYVFLVDKSPLSYFLEEMHNGNSLRSTTTLGNEKERERVYDTIFRLPWRCELFKRLSAVELSDFGCFLIMSCGVILLQQTDISLIYHMIRGQGTIKLYVVYNVLEIFDKLCQSFNGDVLQTFFHSAEGLASCPPESMRFWIWRFIADESLAIAASIVHSFILLAQAITLSTCIVAHNNALFALLVSNNFAEIKSNVFKRYSRDNVHSLVYFDSIERFHISAFILFVLAQNILEAEGPWFESFLSNVLLVYVCEMIIDIIKHSFIAKFNDIKPTTYSEFLEDLCKQTLNMQTEGVKKNLTFVPLAPASVVIRVLTPVFSVNIPPNPLPWRLFWILLFTAITYVMLTSLKVLVGLGLQKHATWYVNRRRKHHLHAD
ncbi:protein POLLEN DEFECTIVE IN GUIDANCE 1 isoform X2 [Arachis ipaensis]|uniref:protein POLLEN DEFECTIVE IN GUIDANCE 1 isoform X2 n=1 Tax=Arachis ipaensis TaxID=130454 RepID=UPI000A2B0238|nr:protein POLLEN DEFECTIVE IN GUIDANCE 1 isoform X2 [Arachis ipaensis]XP_025641480.1 protein POLLEN DEFECTIVE IN GUIDANCE 1 isoform X2 [Arachis hypogaea]